jgi:hypothetical protein
VPLTRRRSVARGTDIDHYADVDMVESNLEGTPTRVPLTRRRSSMLAGNSARKSVRNKEQCSGTVNLASNDPGTKLNRTPRAQKHPSEECDITDIFDDNNDNHNDYEFDNDDGQIESPSASPVAAVAKKRNNTRTTQRLKLRRSTRQSILSNSESGTGRNVNACERIENANVGVEGMPEHVQGVCLRVCVCVCV